MKFNWVRYFSRGFVILICCGAITFGSDASIGVSDSASWVQLSPGSSPPARSYLAMTYDPDSSRIIMFGGFDGTGYLNDTWTFDGVTWTQVVVSHSPPVRANAQIAYDSVTHKVVLFGGYNGTNYLGDTWLWDGTTSRWTRARTAHRPRPVTGPMLFPDPNGRVNLFGGFDGHFYQLTMWEWTGSDWTQLFPAAVPFARSGAAVATTPTIDQVVLFGGLADVNPNNTWTYNSTTWTLQSPVNQPLLVYAASAAFDPNINAVILFGGGSGGVDQNTTWQWFVSGGFWNWALVATTQSPPPREGAGMAYLPALGRLIVFGGQESETPLNDTWQFIP
jgi:Galactose oxidase, central domain